MSRARPRWLRLASLMLLAGLGARAAVGAESAAPTPWYRWASSEELETTPTTPEDRERLRAAIPELSVPARSLEELEAGAFGQAAVTNAGRTVHVLRLPPVGPEAHQTLREGYGLLGNSSLQVASRRLEDGAHLILAARRTHRWSPPGTGDGSSLLLETPARAGYQNPRLYCRITLAGAAGAPPLTRPPAHPEFRDLLFDFSRQGELWLSRAPDGTVYGSMRATSPGVPCELEVVEGRVEALRIWRGAGLHSLQFRVRPGWLWLRQRQRGRVAYELRVFVDPASLPLRPEAARLWEDADRAHRLREAKREGRLVERASVELESAWVWSQRHPRRLAQRLLGALLWLGALAYLGLTLTGRGSWVRVREVARGAAWLLGSAPLLMAASYTAVQVMILVLGPGHGGFGMLAMAVLVVAGTVLTGLAALALLFRRLRRGVPGLPGGPSGLEVALVLVVAGALLVS